MLFGLYCFDLVLHLFPRSSFKGCVFLELGLLHCFRGLINNSLLFSFARVFVVVDSFALAKELSIGVNGLVLCRLFNRCSRHYQDLTLLEEALRVELEVCLFALLTRFDAFPVQIFVRGLALEFLKLLPLVGKEFLSKDFEFLGVFVVLSLRMVESHGIVEYQHGMLSEELWAP